jgi:hypothetical protein
MVPLSEKAPPPTLEREDLELLMELLEREASEIPSEIHHTHTPDYRDRLIERLNRVRDLISRMHKAI